MAVPRGLAAMPAPAFRFAAPHLPKASPSAARQFTSSMGMRLSAKRKLVTTSTYRTETLQPPPPPPRNANAVDTSISESIPPRPPLQPSTFGRRPQLPTEETASISLPEHEAQQSRPTAAPKPAATASAPAAPEPAPQPARRPKLRPRKAAIHLTPTAVAHLRALLDEPAPRLIRVGVRNRGCSGLAYHLEYVERAGAFDEAVEQDGVRVLIDSKALFSIIGSEMDWVEDKLNQRFVFRNPNISE